MLWKKCNCSVLHQAARRVHEFQSQARPPLPCHDDEQSRARRDHKFQSQARPPLPCHELPPVNLQDDGLVSISGETTAPLPRTESYSLQGACSPFQSQARPPLPCHSSSTRPRFVPGWFQSQARPPLPCHKNNLLVRTPYHCCFNLRRDHRSLATVKIGMASQGRYQFQSQARPPLPCHLTVHCPFDNDDYSFNLRRDHRSLATLSDLALTALLDVFQSQARPPLPCHRPRRLIRACAIQVSISGETTAPLPPRNYRLAAPLQKSFNLRRDKRSLATERNEPIWIGSHGFQSQARPPLPCHPEFTEAEALLLCVSISGETTAPLPLI